MGTTYISVQRVDYDDYPIGSDTKIGPFENKEAAEAWLEDSPKFTKSYYTQKRFSWVPVGWAGKTTVYIKDLLDTYMTSPEAYNER
jgi:hypothetical protein